MQYYPVVLFTYNRPEHTLRTLDALKANPEALQTHLIIYSDAARNQTDFVAVQRVREILRIQKGFKTVTIIERETNFGLFRNIREALDEVFQKEAALIILEDDLTPTTNFLAYMNQGLSYYANSGEIGSVTAFHYPTNDPQNNLSDVFLFPRFSCWGWGTWRDRWQAIDWQLPSRKSFLREREPLDSLHQASNDLPEILLDRIEEKNSSWSIYVCLDHVRKKQFCVYPVISKVQNHGFDGTGVHSLFDQGFHVEQDSSEKKEFDFTLTYSDTWAKPLFKYFKNSWKRKLKNLIQYGRYF